MTKDLAGFRVEFLSGRPRQGFEATPYPVAVLVQEMLSMCNKKRCSINQPSVKVLSELIN